METKTNVSDCDLRLTCKEEVQGLLPKDGLKKRFGEEPNSKLSQRAESITRVNSIANKIMLDFGIELKRVERQSREEVQGLLLPNGMIASPPYEVVRLTYIDDLLQFNPTRDI